MSELVGVDHTCDAPSNSIVFKVVPPPGATILANYDAQCFCEAAGSLKLPAS